MSSRSCAFVLAALLLQVARTGWAAESDASKHFFLPQNPVAAAYVLGRLSNQELVAAPRSEFVYVALLEQKGLDRKYRLEALDGLSRIRQTDNVSELVRALQDVDKKGEDSNEPIQDLGQLLLHVKPEELQAKREALAKLEI